MLSRTMKLVALLSAALLGVSHAAPQEEFAFNSQLPPVARWGQEYSYTLSSDTYKSTQGETVNYSSKDLPSWLTLNGRVLSGTPSGGQGDQTIAFQLDASDSTGTSSSQCTLQITNENAPSYSPAELEQTLKSSGEIASPNSFVLVPGKPFDIEFPQDFFTSDGRAVVGHYAVTGDHSPLPIWLDFDGGAGRFSGTAPTVNSGIAQAQQFPIDYIVSTFEGFASAQCEFNFVLGANILSMNISTDPVNATVNQPFTYDVPFSEITFNGAEIQKDNISSVTANIPGDVQSWLKFDESNYTLYGTAPESAAGTNFTVDMSIFDKFQDTVSWGVQVIVNDRDNTTVFTTSSLPSANATRGRLFEYDLEPYLLNKNVALSLSGDSWLSLNEDNLTITGMVPYSFHSSVVNITVSGFNKRDANYEAVSKDKDSSMTAHLTIYGTGPISSSVSSSMMSSTARSSSSHASSNSRSASNSNSRTTSGSSARHHSHSSGFAKATSTFSSSHKASQTASQTSSATSSGTGLAPVSKSSKSSNGVAIGCGVGISLGVVALAAAAFLVFCCRRRRRAAAAGAGTPTDLGPDGAAGISAPRPSSKGMAMAPVFRSESSGSSLYDDALEGDDGTIFGTPEKNEKLNKEGETWGSPQRASTMNFLAMDGGEEPGDSTDETLPLPRQPDETTITNISPIVNTPGTIPRQSEEDDVFGDIPRESWRHTNTGDRRWQDSRLSQSSMASIVPTEPPTVHMAASEFPMEPGLQREYSSGVLHRVGSHSSSTYTSHSGAPDENRLSQQLTEHYRSASSGGSRVSNELSDDSIANFRAYHDENGELHWREQEEDTSGAARLGEVGLDRKASEAKTPKGDTGEFVFV